MNWTAEDPGAGSPAEIRGYAKSRGTLAATLRNDAAAGLQAALANMSDWSAATADAVRSVTTRLQPEPSLIADQMDAQASALSAYAAELERIQARVRSIRTRREDLASKLWAADLATTQYSTPYTPASGTDEANQARLERRITVLTDQLSQLDVELRALAADRESADAACVAALSGAGVVGALATFTLGSSAGVGLLAKLASLSPIDLLILAQANPAALQQLRTAPPSTADVAAWWTSLDGSAQAALIAAAPAVIGSLNGVPALARVEANRVNSIALLAASRAELTALTGRPQEKTFWDWFNVSQTGGYGEARQESDSRSRISMLKQEIAYLERVSAGEVQLYLYEREGSRIVEMIGTPSSSASKVITYVPGTFTSLFDFYRGGVQQVGKYMEEADPAAIVFVYKDGIFPGENRETGAMNLARIIEANDEQVARSAGVALSQFDRGMRADPFLGSRQHIAIGHSWGLANITSAEVAGAQYNKVVSLSGAGMLPDWQPNAATRYADYSYRDLLQTAQELDAVWDGNNPRSNSAFEHGEFFVGPNDAILDAETVTVNVGGAPQPAVDARAFQVLLDNHNLIASDARDNLRALRELRVWIYK